MLFLHFFIKKIIMKENMYIFKLGFTMYLRIRLKDAINYLDK